MSRFAGVLFDVDDTLYDRRAAQGQILRDVQARLPDLFGDLGHEAIDAAFEESDRRTADTYMLAGSIEESRDERSRIFLEVLDLPPARARQVSLAYVDAYRRTNAPIAGAAETVRRCARHLPVGIVSNAFPDVQYHKIDSLGIRELCACVLLSEEFGTRKPEPAIFLAACEQLGIDAGQTLYVGDSYGNDVVGAGNAGLVSCWFNPAARPRDEGAAAPDYEIRALAEVVGILGLPA